MRTRSTSALVAAPLAAALLFAGCGGASDTEVAGGGPHLVVGVQSAADPAAAQVSTLLSHLYGTALEDAGASVSYVGLGERDTAGAPALVAGKADLLVDQIGPFLASLDPAATSGAPLDRTAASVRAAASGRGLTVGAASPATSGHVFVVLKDLSNKAGVTKVSDLHKLDTVTLAGPLSCSTSPTCLGGLQSVYGLTSATLTGTVDDAGTKAALSAKTVDVGELTSSDPDLAPSGKFVVLDDDDHAELAGNVVPVVRSGRATPAVVAVLDRVSATLSQEAILDMMKKVDAGADPVGLAGTFIRSKDL